MNKIGIILDSNTFYVTNYKNYDKLQFLNNLETLVKDFKYNRLNTKVEVLLSNIVIDELIEQQVESYFEKYRKENGISKFMGTRMIKSEEVICEYRDKLKKDINKYINNMSEQYNIEINTIEYPLDIEILDLIDMAVKKKPPFQKLPTGKNRASDKGFKDVILWKTLISYKDKHRDGDLILCSSDDIFRDESLQREYEDKFNEMLHITSWNKGKPELIKLVGKIFNINTELSYGEKIINSFRKSVPLEKLIYGIQYSENRFGKDYKLKNIESYSIDEIENFKESSENELICDILINLEIQLENECIYKDKEIVRELLNEEYILKLNIKYDIFEDNIEIEKFTFNDVIEIDKNDIYKLLNEKFKKYIY